MYDYTIQYHKQEQCINITLKSQFSNHNYKQSINACQSFTISNQINTQYTNGIGVKVSLTEKSKFNQIQMK